MSKAPLLSCQNVEKIVQNGEHQTKILDRVNLTLQTHQHLAIVGSSGSGKSTLLHILGGLEYPTSGSVYFESHAFQQLNHKHLNIIRNRYIGFIYQFHHLLPAFTVLENVCLPLYIQGISKKEAQKRASALLEQLNLTHRIQHKPSALSGGEKQRTAIARAFITNPKCVFADEPTGNLDQETANTVFNTLLTFHQTSIVLVTHDLQLAKKMDKILQLKNGKLIPFIA